MQRAKLTKKSLLRKVKIYFLNIRHSKRKAGPKNHINGPSDIIESLITGVVSSQKFVYGSMDLSFIEFRSVQMGTITDH